MIGERSMTEREIEILTLLQNNPMISQQELADKLFISRSTLSVHIKNLTDQGYIKGRRYVFSDDYVVCAGTTNVDITAFATLEIISEDKNPQARIKMSAGGAARNIGENLARMGLSVKLLTAVGDDKNNSIVFESGKSCGIDMSHIQVVPSENTSAYICLVQPDGNVSVGITDMHLTEYLTPEYFESKKELIDNARVLVITPCIPESSLKYIQETFLKTQVFVDIVTSRYVEKMNKFLPMIHTLRINALAAKKLTGVSPVDIDNLRRCAKWILSRGVDCVFITLGKEGSYYQDQSGNSERLSAPSIDDIVSVSGAGSAFTAGIVYSHFGRFDTHKSLKFASEAAGYALAHQDAISPDISALNILKRMKKV